MQARFKVEIQDILIYMVLKEKDEDGHCQRPWSCTDKQFRNICNSAARLPFNKNSDCLIVKVSL